MGNKPRLTYGLDGSTHACKTEQCGGGVGRNIAEALWRLRGGRTRLLTAIGNDSDGQFLQDIAPGLILDGCIVKSARTAKYAAMFDGKGECLLGLGDMDIHNEITINLVNRHINVFKQAPLVVFDGNVPINTIDYILGLCEEYKKPVFFEPTDRRKAIKPFSGKHSITYASPNLIELRAIVNYVKPDHNITKTEELDEIIELAKIVSKFVRTLIVTRGCKGVVTIKHVSALETNRQMLDVQMYSSDIINNVENVSGAGDCFTSGFIYGFLQKLPESECISVGFATAKEALLCKGTVPIKFKISI